MNSRRWDLNTQLQKVSGSDHVHMSSKLGQQILKAAAAGIPTPPRSSGGSAPDWHGRLTPDVCRSLLDAEEQVKHWSGCLQERKEALRTLLEAQCLQSSMTRSVGAVIQQLRAKRASLEMATKHRTPVRR